MDFAFALFVDCEAANFHEHEERTFLTFVGATNCLSV